MSYEKLDNETRLNNVLKAISDKKNADEQRIKIVTERVKKVMIEQLEVYFRTCNDDYASTLNFKFSTTLGLCGIKQDNEGNYIGICTEYDIKFRDFEDALLGEFSQLNSFINSIKNNNFGIGINVRYPIKESNLETGLYEIKTHNGYCEEVWGSNLKFCELSNCRGELTFKFVVDA